MSAQHRLSLLSAIKTSDGSVVQPDDNGDVTLTATTYVFLLGGAGDAPLESAHIMTDGTIALTSVNVETSNLPRNDDKTGTARNDQVLDYSTTVGHWIAEVPSGNYVATTGTGWAGTTLPLSKTAGAGGAMLHLGNMGARRLRLIVVVGTGGKMRVAGHAKS